MRAVDTNVLVRLLARDHPKQLAAAEAFVQTGAWISHLSKTMRIEAAYVLAASPARNRSTTATSSGGASCMG